MLGIRHDHYHDVGNQTEGHFCRLRIGGITRVRQVDCPTECWWNRLTSDQQAVVRLARKVPVGKNNLVLLPVWSQARGWCWSHQKPRSFPSSTTTATNPPPMLPH